MADTGWVSPGTVVGNRGTLGPSWSNPTNADTADSVYADVVVTSAVEASRGLAASNFDFSGIPAGAHIDGIEVGIQAYFVDGVTASPALSNNSLILADNTDGSATKIATAPTTSTQNSTLGGPTDTWGESLTRADVQDVDFGFFVVASIGSAISTKFQVDQLRMKVYYHEGLPTPVFSGDQPRGKRPPMKSTSGDFYAVALDDVNDRIAVYKTTTSATSWTEQDSADAPTVTTAASDLALSCIIDGNLIHIAHLRTGVNMVLEYARFDCSTDQWVTAEEQTVFTNGTNPETSAHLWCDIAVRSDGDVIIVNSGNNDKIMGGNKMRVDYARYNGTAWSSQNAVDGGGDIHYGNPVCVLGSGDGTHIFWQETSYTFNDPATRWEDLEGRTLDSGDNLSTTQNTAWPTANDNASMLTLQNAVFYDDAGTGRIFVCGVFDELTGDSIIPEIRAVEDGSDDLSSLTITHDEIVSGTDPRAWTDVVGSYDKVACGMALDGTDIHLLYSGGGAGVSDQDIYYVNSLDDGATWSTPSEELDAITCEHLSTEVYVRGAATVLAYLYLDGTNLKYGEYILDAGANTASGSPTAPETTASGTASLAPLTASGTPNAPETTASGTAALQGAPPLTASGSTEAPTATASGAARIVRRASGAVTLAATAALGVATLGSLEASGDVTAEATTASGTAQIVSATTASGSPNTPEVTASGVATIVGAIPPLTASGSLSAEETTASGTARLVLEASGSLSTDETTASGTAALGPLEASGSLNAAETTASGTATLGALQASGDLNAPETTASGTATLGALQASGDVQVAEVTASGTAGRRTTASGSPSTAETTASGVATLAGGPLAATGSLDAPETTASGTATLGPLEASGSLNAPETTASGTAGLGPLTASGDSSVSETIASGTAQVISATTASGSPNVEAATASGTATLGPLTATGDVNTAEVTASGTVGRRTGASGSLDAPETTASGIATLAGSKAAVGSTDTPTTEASGTATLGPLEASGSVNTAEVTASGEAGYLLSASGSPSTAETTASGTAAIASATQASGSPETPTVTASGTATLGALQASGSVEAAEVTASGVANFAGQVQASGSPQTAEVTASGTATLGPLQASGSVQAPTTTADGTAAGPIPPEVISGGGGSMGQIPKKHRRPLKGLSLRTQPIKDEEIEELIEEIVDEVIDEVESVEEQTEETTVPGQDIAKLANKRVLARQSVVRGVRKAEKVSQRLAEAQLQARINELVRQRREFFISEDEDLAAILFILSELV